MVVTTYNTSLLTAQRYKNDYFLGLTHELHVNWYFIIVNGNEITIVSFKLCGFRKDSVYIGLDSRNENSADLDKLNALVNVSLFLLSIITGFLLTVVNFPAPSFLMRQSDGSISARKLWSLQRKLLSYPRRIVQPK